MNLPPDSRYSLAVKEPPMRLPYRKPFFIISSRFPIKGGTVPRALFILLSKSLVDEPSNRFPSGAPVGRDACLQNLFYISFNVLSKVALPPDKPTPGCPTEPS